MTGQRQQRESAAADLRAVAVHAVRIYLEIASGRRPARTISNLASPVAVEQMHAAAEHAGNDRRPARIQRIALRRPAANRTEITALIRDHHGHVSAVTMALQRLAHQRWLIADVHHLDRGHHLTHPHTADRGLDVSPEASLAAGRFDLALLHGAAATADHRAHTLTDPDHRAAAERAAAQWRQRARRLAAELASPEQPATQAPDRPAGYQLQLLGPPPGDDHARGLWHAAAGLLDNYRTKWNVTDVFHPLGRSPAAGRQRDDRQHTLTRISKLVREIATAELAAPTRPPPGQATAAELDGP